MMPIMKRALLIAVLIAAACHRREVATYPNAPVILISIDTVRADHLPMFGYRGLETPNLDAFRDDAVLFTTVLLFLSHLRAAFAVRAGGAVPLALRRSV